jgi:hypothetical protein
MATWHYEIPHCILNLGQVHAQGNEADSVSAPRTNPQGSLSIQLVKGIVTLSLKSMACESHFKKSTLT